MGGSFDPPTQVTISPYIEKNVLHVDVTIQLQHGNISRLFILLGWQACIQPKENKILATKTWPSVFKTVGFLIDNCTS